MYGMDQHHLRSNAIKTEFDLFYQGLFNNIDHLPENTISHKKQNYDEFVKVIVKSVYHISINKLSMISLKTTTLSS